MAGNGTGRAADARFRWRGPLVRGRADLLCLVPQARCDFLGLCAGLVADRLFGAVDGLARDVFAALERLLAGLACLLADLVGHLAEALVLHVGRRQ
jgi:hypothetical protein